MTLIGLCRRLRTVRTHEDLTEDEQLARFPNLHWTSTLPNGKCEETCLGGRMTPNAEGRTSVPKGADSRLLTTIWAKKGGNDV
jgi:hypothetical protein